MSEHSEPSNWKEKAKYVRDLNYEILGKATEKGSGPFKATQELFEQITACWMVVRRRRSLQMTPSPTLKSPTG